MILASNQSEVKPMQRTIPNTRAKREASLHDVKRQLAQAIEQDRPASEIRRLREKVQVIEWLLTDGDE